MAKQNKHMLSIARADITKLNRIAVSAVGYPLWHADQKVETSPGSDVFVPADPIVSSGSLDVFEEAGLRKALAADSTVRVSGERYSKATRGNVVADAKRIRAARKIDDEPDFTRPGKKVKDVRAVR